MTPGIGYAFRGVKHRNSFDRQANDPTINNNPTINAVEIDLDSSNDDVPVARYVSSADFDIVSIHVLQWSLASTATPCDRRLNALRAMAFENGARSVSGHLRFDRRANQVKRSNGASSLSSIASLDSSCRTIERVQRHLGPVCFYLESASRGRNAAHKLIEAERLAKTFARTACGWLLDITRLYADSLNSGQDAYDVIEAIIPSVSRVQMHLSGVAYDETTEQFHVSTAHAIPEAMFELYAFVLEVAFDKVDSVFIQRDCDKFETEFQDEIRTVREIAEGVSAIV